MGPGKVFASSQLCTLWADQTIDAGRPAVITASSRGLTWTIRNDPANTTPVLAAVNVRTRSRQWSRQRQGRSHQNRSTATA